MMAHESCMRIYTHGNFHDSLMPAAVMAVEQGLPAASPGTFGVAIQAFELCMQATSM